MFSLPDKSTILDTNDVTVSSFKSLTNNSNSRNESNDSPAPPITSLMSIMIRSCNALLKSAMSLTASLLKVDISVTMVVDKKVCTVLISVEVSLLKSEISTLTV